MIPLNTQNSPPASVPAMKRSKSNFGVSLIPLLILVIVTSISCTKEPTANFRGDNALSAAAQEILRSPEVFWLYSLDPVPADQRLTPQPPPSTNAPPVRMKEIFHGHEVLGRAEIKDKTQQAALIKELDLGIKEGKGPPPACFNPRHGIRAVKGDQSVDLVICFECISIREYTSAERSIYTSPKPQKAFNDALLREKLPLAEQW